MIIKNNNWKLLALVLFCINSSSLVAQETLLNKPDEAVAKAFEYLGLPDISGQLHEQLKRSVKVVTFVDTTTPFIAHLFNNKRAWQLKADSIVLNNKWTDSAYAFERPKNLTLFIDSISGNLIMIQFMSGVLKNLPQPPANKKYAEEKLINYGEQYLGFPHEKECRSFWHILNSNYSVIPSTADIVEARLMSYYYKTGYIADPEDTTDVWIICLRGLPPKEHRSEQIDPGATTFERTIIRAVDGQGIRRSNFPRNREVREIKEP